MASQPKPLRRGAYIDQDTSDAFLDGPPDVHTVDGKKRPIRWSDIEARRRERPGGPPTLPQSHPDA